MDEPRNLRQDRRRYPDGEAAEQLDLATQEPELPFLGLLGMVKVKCREPTDKAFQNLSEGRIRRAHTFHQADVVSARLVVYRDIQQLDDGPVVLIAA